MKQTDRVVSIVVVLESSFPIRSSSTFIPSLISFVSASSPFIPSSTFPSSAAILWLIAFVSPLMPSTLPCSVDIVSEILEISCNSWWEMSSYNEFEKKILVNSPFSKKHIRISFKNESIIITITLQQSPHHWSKPYQEEKNEEKKKIQKMNFFSEKIRGVKVGFSKSLFYLQNHSFSKTVMWWLGLATPLHSCQSFGPCRSNF